MRTKRANALIRNRSIYHGSRYVIAIGILRLIRSWNQTGQKFTGEPDTVKMFISPNPAILWVLVILSYGAASLQLMQSVHEIPTVVIASITSVLVSSAFAFKLAFTAEDAPELVTGFAEKLNTISGGQSLLTRARIVFMILTAIFCFAVYQARSGGSRAMSSGR